MSKFHWERRILRLADDSVLVECGPMRMFIEGSLDGLRRPDICAQGAREAIGLLEEVAEAYPKFKAPFGTLPELEKGSLAHEMWSAVATIGAPDLTPMAAVAGTIADATADLLVDLGLSRIVVNNGGDVAFRLRPPESLTVGIRPEVALADVSHSVTIRAEDSIGGVCTSGLGGRSFTRGVASAVTVLAGKASTADAAATAVANATFVDAPTVGRARADMIDPSTDIAGLYVTVDVGALNDALVAKALSLGINLAEDLVERGLIAGACLFVKGRMALTSGMIGRLRPLG